MNVLFHRPECQAYFSGRLSECLEYVLQSGDPTPANWYVDAVVPGPADAWERVEVSEIAGQALQPWDDLDTHGRQTV